MNKRKPTLNISNKRLLSWDEAREYCGMGRSSVRKYGERIGAIRYYGKRVLFDRLIIDESITGETFLK